MAERVLILGAGWTGLPLAHKLLKYTAPKTSVKVILVTPNTHFFWNVAATRGIIPGEFAEDQLFLPIEDGFKRYASESFEFILGSAKSINSEENTVVVATNGGTRRAVSYTHLVIATGSRLSSGLPLKPLGSHETTISAWRKLQANVEKSRDIVVAGSGPTGVEVAGELAAKYGADKRITLVMSGNKPLESHASTLSSVQDTADSDLRKLGVTIIRNKRVAEVISGGAKSRIVLSDGSELEAGCYLPLFGVKLNSSFVPSHMLDSHGSIAMDDYMRVVGSHNIWALGDIGSVDPKQITITDNQIIYLAEALHTILAGSKLEKKYVPEKKSMVFLSLGRKRATGQVGSWKLFGFLVSWVKGRTLFTDAADDYVQGRRLRHSAL